MTDKTYTPEETEKFRQKIEPESRPLFAAILNLRVSHPTSCQAFEQFIEKHYHKKKPITHQQLKLWASLYGSIKPLPKWLFSAAIDFLMIQNINPITLIPVEKVAEHWARQRKLEGLDEKVVKQQFMTLFTPPSSQLPTLINVIDTVYAKPLPPAEFL